MRVTPRVRPQVRLRVVLPVGLLALVVALAADGYVLVAPELPDAVVERRHAGQSRPQPSEVAAWAPAIRIVVDEAGLEEPVHDGGLRLRIFGRGDGGPDVPLPGAEVRRERPGARWRPAGQAALAVADDRGQVDLSARELQPDEHLAVDKVGYVSRSLRVASCRWVRSSP